MKTIIFSLLMTASLSAFAVEKPDFMPCLSSLNENSPLWKGQLVALDEHGWNFVVKEERAGTYTVVLDNSKYWVDDNAAKSQTHKNNSALREIRVLFRNSINAKGIAEDVKQEIISHCQPLENTSWGPSRRPSSAKKK